MSRKLEWKLVFGGALFISTIILYAIRWTAFGSASLHNEMLRFLVGDLGFLALQVLVVTIFLESYLKKRERDSMRVKLNMIVGAFFSDNGFQLLRLMAEVDDTSDELKESISPDGSWSADSYRQARAYFSDYSASIQPTTRRLVQLKDHLCAKKGSVLALLANQALLEHEQFADLLWAITHLTEELEARHDIAHLPKSDIAHLSVDIERAYSLLVTEWLDYSHHLQDNYPYLFSLAVRNNPLNPIANAEVL